MKTILKFIILSTFIISCNQNKKILSEDSIIGQWECVFGCDAEFYIFSESNLRFEYYTYKNQKIYQNGEYQIKDSILTLFYGEGLSTEFIVEYRNDSLLLNNGLIILKYYNEKIQEKTLTNELFRELEDLLKVFPNFEFGNLEPIDFTFKSLIIEDQFEPITVAGIKVEAPVTLTGEFVSASDVIHRITNVFIEQGFTHDEFNDSENCSFYTNENMVIQICSIAGKNELLTDEIKIVIKFGFI